MGVRVRLVLYAPDEATAERAAIAAFRRFAELEDIMSDYRPTSELMRLCARAGGPPVAVSADLFRVLQRAREMACRTGGAFDVTVGPYVALWREARRRERLPGRDALEEAGRRVGWRKLVLDPEKRTAQLLAEGMRLDLGGIAKGYAAGEAFEVLKRHGIRRALVEAGGDIVVGDPPPGQEGWRIAIGALPADAKERFLTLANQAVSTSGDTEQFVEIGGRRYSHVVDPRTGLGLTSRLAATVVAPDPTTSDSLATAVTVLGPEKGRALVESTPGASLYVRTAR